MTTTPTPPQPTPTPATPTGPTPTPATPAGLAPTGPALAQAVSATQAWEPSAEAARLAAELNLAPHPEGGWFRRTWTAPTTVTTPRGDRRTASGIIFLLDDNQEATWHKVASDELWLWHGPGDLEIHLGGAGDTPTPDPQPTILTCAPGRGLPRPQILIPAGVWQRTFARSGVALATCVVSPEFTFDDWQLCAQ